ncbi:MAG: 4-amino-4-deoxy-L-arabinose transferase [Arachnia sp.]
MDVGLVASIISLAAARRPTVGAAVVAIDGPSGAGKTTLAAALAEELESSTGVRPPTIATDDMCGGWDGLPQVPDALARGVLGPMAAGQPGCYRRFDWVAYGWAPGQVIVPPARWLIVEGVAAGARAGAAYLATIVWLEADRDVRRRRGLGRPDAEFAVNWDRWAGHEARHFDAERTRERADLVLDTTTG